MSLNFKKVSFKNFLSFGNTLTTINLDTNKTTLIYGENGSGKTTIMETIFFALIGKPFRKIKKSELINTTNLKDLYVELDFEFENDLYTIKRGIKPDIFQIEKNHKLVDIDGAIKDYQTIIDRMIGVDAKTFTDTIFISSKNYTPFMNLKASDKRNFIENVFGLKEFSIMADELKIKRSLTTNDISDLEKDIHHQNSLLDMAEETNKKTNSNNDILIKENQKQIEEEKKQGKKLSEEKQKINEWLIEKDVENKIKNYTKRLDFLTDKQSKIFEQKNKILFETEKLLKESEFLKNNTVCPQCKQPIETESDFLKKYLSELEKTTQSNHLKIEDYIKEITKYADEIEDINKKSLILNKNHDRACSRLSEIENGIKYHIKTIKSLETSLNALNDKNNDELIDIKPYQEKLSKFKIELVTKSNRLDRIKTLIKMIGDKGIKSFVIDKYIPTLNQLINKWLGLFNASYRVKFDKLFNISIIARGYEKLSYESFSSGECQRVDLSLLFAFHELSVMKNSMDMNLLLLDEISDKSLDSDGLEGLFLAFEFFKSKGISIFNITHREIKERFDISIKVNKNKFSKIEVE